jgi:hypothetical protein
MGEAGTWNMRPCCCCRGTSVCAQHFSHKRHGCDGENLCGQQDRQVEWPELSVHVGGFQGQVHPPKRDLTAELSLTKNWAANRITQVLIKDSLFGLLKI